MAKVGELSDKKKEQAAKLAQYMKNDTLTDNWEREVSKRDGQSGKFASRENLRQDDKLKEKLMGQLIKNGMSEKEARERIADTDNATQRSIAGRRTGTIPKWVENARGEMEEYEDERGKYPTGGPQYYVDGQHYEDTRLGGDRYTGRGSVHKIDKNGKRQSGGYVGREPAYSAIKRGKAD